MKALLHRSVDSIEREFVEASRNLTRRRILAETEPIHG